MTEDKPKIAVEKVRLVVAAGSVRLLRGDSWVGLRVGANLDGFQIEKLIGRGGASEVYHARDTRS